MPQVIRVRDVVHASTYSLDPGLRAMRVPYEMFNPDGAVRQHGDVIEWDESHASRSARFAEARLGDCAQGERVLLRLPFAPSETDWWLCEVEAVDDVEGND
jgi:hypothetical protein